MAPSPRTPTPAEVPVNTPVTFVTAAPSRLAQAARVGPGSAIPGEEDVPALVVSDADGQPVTDPGSEPERPGAHVGGGIPDAIRAPAGVHVDPCRVPAVQPDERGAAIQVGEGAGR